MLYEKFYWVGKFLGSDYKPITIRSTVILNNTSADYQL